MNTINIILANPFFGQIRKHSRSLLLVGKSAGGMLAWNACRLHYQDIKDRFGRFALVLVDPHGAVTGDWRDGRVGRETPDTFGTYSSGQDLWWPPNWPASDVPSVFRAYNIFEQESPNVVDDFSRGLAEGMAAVRRRHRSGPLPLEEVISETSDAVLPTLTGANFPSSNVSENRRLEGGGIDHFNITQHRDTSLMIGRAFSFVRHGL